ncbi:hypothetical protein GWI33_005930 [Rhynchophorus ferrugineus]|uniref:Uncharacterized protein n=1 Tax=Rhynchophorus ferrugineus TaxID=354439 RepID=A0A834IV12_RHYFE|nr:hypothetical protein GWI33_005930 [Rhynchophorus ferrugineus]
MKITLCSLIVILHISTIFADDFDEFQIQEISNEVTALNLNSDDIGKRFKQNIVLSLLDIAVTRLYTKQTADVTNYTQQILDNLKPIIIEQGLDPLELPDEEIDLLIGGSVTLTNGWLEDFSTIGVYDTVKLSYNNETNIIDLTLPLSFDELMAKISDVKLSLHLGFDFNSYEAFVDEIDVKNSGSISFDFSGLGLLDWVIEAMSTVLTILFHDIILGVINAIIYNPVENVVENLNEKINEFLHTNSTAIQHFRLNI